MINSSGLSVALAYDNRLLIYQMVSQAEYKKTCSQFEDSYMKLENICKNCVISYNILFKISDFSIYLRENVALGREVMEVCGYVVVWLYGYEG